MILLTRAVLRAGIHWMSSGTRVPDAVNGAKEITALDGIRKKGSAIDAGSGGAEASQRICRGRDAEQEENGDHNSAN